MTQRSMREVLAGRGFLLLPAAALAVHELRYRLAYGGGAASALASQGHSYLDSLAPWLVLLLGLALGGFLVRVAGSASGRSGGGPQRSFATLWLVATASLVVTYVLQELLEGVFAAGHPCGFSGLYGHGGFWALAAAVVLGALVAALLRLSSAVVSALRRCLPKRRPATVELVRPRPAVLVPLGALAWAAAGRAPPCS